MPSDHPPFPSFLRLIASFVLSGVENFVLLRVLTLLGTSTSPFVLLILTLSKSMRRCAPVRFPFVYVQCCRPRVHLDGVVRHRFAWARRRPGRSWEQPQGEPLYA